MGAAQEKDCGCNYRAFQRIPCETSIVYSYFHTERYFTATMVNCCSGGIYFESDNAIPAGADITIKMVDKVPAMEKLGFTDGCRVEVMWCRETGGNGDKPHYGIGVRFMTNTCNQCGEKIPYNEIRKTDNFVCLCKACSTRMAVLSEGKLKESIENYLLGNVV